MHKEFAIDPNVVSSWERLQFLSNCVGFDKGRVVVGCPNKVDWYRTVHKLCASVDDKTNKVAEKLIRLIFDKKAVVNKELSDWDNNEEWLLNVIREDEHVKGGLCDGIVTKAADPNRPKVVGFDSLDDENPVWMCIPGQIPRESKWIVQAARILLRYSSEIVVIDRYINPSNTRYSKPLSSFLDAVFSSSSRPNDHQHVVGRLEFHIFDDPDSYRFFSSDRATDLYSSKFSKHIPIGNSLVIKRWRPERGKMHARYILTELGGISYDHGLDEGAETTDVHLMSEQLWRERWNNLVLNPVLNLADEEPIVIAGRKH
jgi:hypothetical protein